MDERISTSSSEKETSPVLNTLQQLDEDAYPLASGLLSPVLQRGRRSTGRGFWLNFFRGYGATLIMGLPVLPIVVSAVTIGIYLSNPSDSGWVSIVSGAAVTYLGWWLISLLLIPLTSPRNANSRSYGLLESRLHQLETRLHTIRNEHPDEKVLPEYRQVALNEAFDKLQEIAEDLYESNTRLPWAMGYGYINIWGKMHRAEEALVEVEPQEMAMRGAMHDKMAITGSHIPNRDELLAKLLYAVKKLDPSMAALFKPAAAVASPGEAESPEVQQLEQDVQKIAHHIGLKLDRDTSSSNSGRTRPSHDGEDDGRARLTLREVRSYLNGYRDHLWEGLVRVRNNLLGVTFVTGLGLYILLCIAILVMTPVIGASRVTIVSATAYYLVGAIAGLISTISNEPVVSTTINDYNLSFARLLATFVLSGLAAIGGVLVVGLLYGLLFGGHTTYSLLDIFQLDEKPYLLVAVVFGFSSNLIIRRMRKSVENYISALNSSSTKKTNQHDEGETRLPLSSKSQLEQIHKYEVYRERRWFSTAIGAAAIGFLFILGGVAALLIKGILPGVMVILLGGVPEIGAFLALQQSKKAFDQLNQRRLKVQERTTSESEPPTPPLKEREPIISTASSSDQNIR